MPPTSQTQQYLFSPFLQLLSRTAVHPSESISTALGRLSPTCRALWSTHWPAQKRLAALTGDEGAAQEVCCY